MRLIAILLALWANHHPERIDRWRRPEPFLHYLSWVCDRWPEAQERDGLLRLAAILLPPLLLFLIIQILLDGWLFGIAEILLGFWALLFLHGPGRTDDQLDDFIKACQERHLGAAQGLAADLAERDSYVELSHAELPKMATEGLLWQTYRRILSGLFWLLLLGPIGPVAVRLAALTAATARSEDSNLAYYSERLLHLIDWLPARAAALSFALVGSFVEAREAWQDAQQTSPDARSLIVSTGVGALDLDEWSEDPDDMVEIIQTTRELAGRSLMIWIAIAALLTIAGWLY